MAMASMSLFLCLPGRVTQPIGSAEIPRPEIPWSKVAALPAAVFPGIDISQRLHGRLSLNDWVRTYTCWVCVCVYYMGMGIYGYGYIYIYTHTHIYIYIWCIYIYIYIWDYMGNYRWEFIIAKWWIEGLIWIYQIFFDKPTFLMWVGDFSHPNKNISDRPQQPWKSALVLVAVG